jgi:hypothetical protein
LKVGVPGHPLVSAVSLVVWGRNPEKEFAVEAAAEELNRHKKDFVMLNSVEQIVAHIFVKSKYF